MATFKEMEKDVSFFRGGDNFISNFLASTEPCQHFTYGFPPFSTFCQVGINMGKANKHLICLVDVFLDEVGKFH